MNIIYLISRAVSSDGPVNQALNILTGLNKIDGVKAMLVTLSPELENKSWLQRFKDNGIEIHQLNQPTYNIHKCIALLKQLIITNKIDVVHSAGYRADIINMYLSHCALTITTQRSNPSELAEDFPRFLRRFISKLHTQVIKRIDVRVACSYSLQNNFEQEEGLKLECVQNAVNTDLFFPVTNIEKNNLRKELGIPIEKRVYLVLGGLIPRKNNKVVINAFIKAKLPNSELILVGGGVDEASLKHIAKGHSEICFAGVSKTPIKYLQSSDILVSSSLAEGLPNTVLEALGCGLPVILSDIDPHKELIGESNVGIIFNRYSDDELSQCLSESLRWDIEDKSKYARQIAENKYSIQVLANNYLRLYQKYLYRINS